MVRYGVVRYGTYINTYIHTHTDYLNQTSKMAITKRDAACQNGNGSKRQKKDRRMVHAKATINTRKELSCILSPCARMGDLAIAFTDEGIGIPEQTLNGMAFSSRLNCMTELFDEHTHATINMQYALKKLDILHKDMPVVVYLETDEGCQRICFEGISKGRLSFSKRVYIATIATCSNTSEWMLNKRQLREFKYAHCFTLNASLASLIAEDCRDAEVLFFRFFTSETDDGRMSVIHLSYYLDGDDMSSSSLIQEYGLVFNKDRDYVPNAKCEGYLNNEHVVLYNRQYSAVYIQEFLSCLKNNRRAHQS